jgi:hypothetical protein
MPTRGLMMHRHLSVAYFTLRPRANFAFNPYVVDSCIWGIHAHALKLVSDEIRRRYRLKIHNSVIYARNAIKTIAKASNFSTITADYEVINASI